MSRSSGDSKSPEFWNDDLSNHGERDGQSEEFTADMGIDLFRVSGSSIATDKSHRYSDLNSAQSAQHHTLGPGHNESSPGDHIHDGGQSKSLPAIATINASLATINSQIAALQALTNAYGTWTDISGTAGQWSSSGTAPAIGNGSQYSKYMVIGKTCWWKWGVIIGTGTTFGTGSWVWNLPVNAKLPAAGAGGLIMGESVGLSGTSSTGSVQLSNTSQVAVVSHASSNPWGPTVPVTWAATAGNRLSINLVYETV